MLEAVFTAAAVAVLLGFFIPALGLLAGQVLGSVRIQTWHARARMTGGFFTDRKNVRVIHGTWDTDDGARSRQGALLVVNDPATQTGRCYRIFRRWWKPQPAELPCDSTGRIMVEEDTIHSIRNADLFRFTVKASQHDLDNFTDPVLFWLAQEPEADILPDMFTRQGWDIVLDSSEEGKASVKRFTVVANSLTGQIDGICSTSPKRRLARPSNRFFHGLEETAEEVLRLAEKDRLPGGFEGMTRYLKECRNPEEIDTLIFKYRMTS